MKKYNKVIFVEKTGTCRAPMAEGVLRDILVTDPIEVCSKGLVVLFPEPINQKAEAVLISNGINFKENYVSSQLQNEDITESTIVFAMEEAIRYKIIEQFENANEDNTFILSDYVGDELEIINPYGAPLQTYGLCYESLRNTMKKLVKILEI
ncbi:arsenate reductase/protein-tyrosine-phosphatase family protein [Lachnobacterium bovis]|uniref:Protein-tyrosine phosphatase n=1 Tax=Lachnobacterium bovis DSM 14045 TaxID=1122142 RepID=A0A1H3G8I6_9FIRM|nr:phosphotyrosine protein phosphatase [Lachnobacterium bovis]SDX98958.1 protein-tyrosine phosphatase [Lachnobacterium bovis DSM 14045]